MSTTNTVPPVEQPVLLVHLATGSISTACGKIPGSFEVDQLGRPVRHTAHLSLSADPVDWPPPLECCPTCWAAAGHRPETWTWTVSGARDGGDPDNLTEEETMTTTVQTTSRPADAEAPPWANEVGPWQQSKESPNRWERLLTGQHFGADVNTLQQWEPGFDGEGVVWGSEILTVTKPGPGCPAWCTEHATDTDGSTLFSHHTSVPVDAPEASVMIGCDAETNQVFIDPQATGGNMWTSDQARSFAAALLAATDLVEGRGPRWDWAALAGWFQRVEDERLRGTAGR